MPDRIFNFSPGPGTLPYSVLQEAAVDIVNFKNTGIGLIEISHRSKEFSKILEDAEANLRELMGIPDNYKVLFLQGGGTLQFAMVPLNLLRKSKKADYILSTSNTTNKITRFLKTVSFSIDISNFSLRKLNRNIIF